MLGMNRFSATDVELRHFDMLEGATKSVSHASIRIQMPGLQPPRALQPTTLEARNQTTGSDHPRPKNLGNEGPGENNRGTCAEPGPPATTTGTMND